MVLIGSSSLSKGSSWRILSKRVASWVRSKPDSQTRRASSARLLGIQYCSREMTFRAFLHGLGSARIDRKGNRGRRLKLFDVGALCYASDGCLDFRFLKRNRHAIRAVQSGDGCIRLRGFYSSNARVEGDTEFSVELTCEGKSHENIAVLATQLQEDAIEATKDLIFWHRRVHQRFLDKEVIELTVALTDDHHIRQLNKEYLKNDRYTDVLSFPMDGTEENEDHLPVLLLGDIVISLDTAARQAKLMKHSLRSECRILLVHALLHLIGYDHDRSHREWQNMSDMEQQTMSRLGWTGSGLIAVSEKGNAGSPLSVPSEASIDVGSPDDVPIRRVTRSASDLKSKAKHIKVVALDMDGTLLTSDQRITTKTKAAVIEAIDRGMHIVVATGKARSGAAAACRAYGLYGDRGLMFEKSAGVFLQGLDVYTTDGRPIKGPSLSSELVTAAFEYAKETGTSVVGFSGDHCVTLEQTQDVLDLHQQYFEPLAEVMPSIDSILHGPPIKKIVFLSDVSTVQAKLQPYWNRQLTGTASQTVLAVANMLEIVPRGTDKWIGLQSLLTSMSLTASACMAVGDGKNDYEMVKNAAMGIAMGNAVEDVKSVADYVVASNDEDGIAEAFEKFLFF